MPGNSKDLNINPLAHDRLVAKSDHVFSNLHKAKCAED